MKYTQINRRTHIYNKLVTAGATGFPIPLRVPPRTSFIPQIKYVLETIIIFCTEKETTASDEDIRKESCLENIAESCGFSDYIYFSRRFKEFKGISPREYMQKQALKQVN